MNTEFLWSTPTTNIDTRDNSLIDSPIVFNSPLDALINLDHTFNRYLRNEINWGDARDTLKKMSEEIERFSSERGAKVVDIDVESLQQELTAIQRTLVVEDDGGRISCAFHQFFSAFVR